MTQPTTDDRPTSTPGAGEVLLSVQSVSFAYGKHPVLSDVSFDVREREFVGIIGPNGSGKSTLLTVLMNLHHPSSGTVEFQAHRVDSMTTPNLARLGIAKTFQHPRVFRSMTVMENMLVGVRGGRAVRRAARAEAGQLLAKVNLTRYTNSPAGALSVGQQKLLDLTRALMLHPKILLLDEVTAGVHPDLIPGILVAAGDCINDGGSIILITHELDIARRTCTRLLALHNGRIIADGLPQDVLGHESVVEAYLGI